MRSRYPWPYTDSSQSWASTSFNRNRNRRTSAATALLSGSQPHSHTACSIWPRLSTWWGWRIRYSIN